jgi:PAS domain S-box-containing protein
LKPPHETPAVPRTPIKKLIERIWASGTGKHGFLPLSKPWPVVQYEKVKRTIRQHLPVCTGDLRQPEGVWMESGHLVAAVILALGLALVFELGRRIGLRHTPAIPPTRLQDAAVLFRALAENSRFGIVVADPDGHFVYANDRYLQHVGATPEEAGSGAWIDHIHPDDRARVQAAWETARTSHSGFVVERRVVRGDGEIRHGRVVAVPINDQSGDFIGFVVTIEDVTEARRTERALRESEEKFSRAFDLFPDLVLISHTEDGRLVGMNKQWTPLTGWSNEEALGRTSIELGFWAHPEERKPMIEEVKAHGEVRAREILVRIKDGTVMPIEYSAQTFMAGGRSHMITVLRDRSAHRKAESERAAAEAALRQSEAKFSAIFHFSPVPLALTLAADNRYVAVNAAWEELLGIAREEAVGRTSLELDLWQSPQARTRLIAMAHQGSLDRHETVLRTRKGHFLHCEVSGRPLDLSENEHLLYAIVDVTALRSAQQEIEHINASLEQRVRDRTVELESTNRELATTLDSLRHAQTELVRAEKMAALGSLVAGVSHELNTPIGNSVLVASTLHDKTQELMLEYDAARLRRSSLQSYAECVRTASDLLLRNLRRAHELVAGFKQVAADQTSEQRRRFDLAQVIEEVVRALAPSMRKRPVTLELDLAPDIHMDSYPGPLGQIIANLVTNALTHGFDDGRAGRLRISCHLTDAHQARMVCSDDGCGIAPEVIGRIFDPFFTTRLGKGGSGLGLHIAYNIATQVLGGDITVTSDGISGTEFVVTLPLVAPQAP